MNKLYIAFTVIFMAFIFYKFNSNHKLIRSLNQRVEDLDIDNKSLMMKHQKLKKAISTKVFKTKEYDTSFKRHMVIVNSDQNVTHIDLPYRLKNVVHVELISGIFPKSQSRINQYNNSFDYLGSNYQIRQGSYSDIISLLMEINQTLHESTPVYPLYFVFDSVRRKVVACVDSTTPMTRTLDFSVPNSIGDVLGFNGDVIQMSNGFVDTFPQNNLISSLNYFYDLRTKSESSNKAINNLPPRTYTFIDNFMLPTGTVDTTVTDNWSFLIGDSRVNMKHQLYIDTELDEVQYWDGSHRLARIFIPESLDETEYTSYNTPIRRSLSSDFINLDKLTVRLKSVVSENKKYDYELQGLNYSLQIEITTADTLLTRDNLLKL